MPPRKTVQPHYSHNSSESDSDYVPEEEDYSESSSNSSMADTENSSSSSMENTENSESDGETINTESDRSEELDEDEAADCESLGDFIVPDEAEEGEEEEGEESESSESESDAPRPIRRFGRAYRVGTISLPCKRLSRILRSMQKKKYADSDDDEEDDPDEYDPDADSETNDTETKNNKHKRQKRIPHYTREEVAYFYKMSPEDQSAMQMQEELIGALAGEAANMPLRFRLLTSPADMDTKRLLLSKLESLNNMSGQEGDYHKMSSWLQAAARLPIGRYKPLPVQRDAGIPAIRDFLENTRTALDTAVYGHRESKEQILRILAQWVSNPNSRGHVIGIQGVQGVGKSSLVKEGIAKALNLPFAYIALGGASDGAFMEGHSITYEGATPGKIAEVVTKANYMNPVIFFDELDKVSDTSKGEEVANILVHLTDAAQNEHFNDKFFTEIDLNLSKALMVFAYNDESKINPILLDRMTIIRVSGYNATDKQVIARKHLLPSILEQHGLQSDALIFTDDILKTIMERVPEEKGVRNLRRGLESIVSWFNMLQYLPDPEFPQEPTDTAMPCTPYEITEAFVRKYLKKQVAAGGMQEHVAQSMYL